MKILEASCRFWELRNPCTLIFTCLSGTWWFMYTSNICVSLWLVSSVMRKLCLHPDQDKKTLSLKQALVYGYHYVPFSSVQSLSRVWLFVTPWIAARQVSPSITNSQRLLRLMFIKSVMPSSHLILCRPLLLLPPIPPSLRDFSNESTLRMRWPKYWSFSFSIIPSKEIPGLISLEWTGWISLQSKGLSRVFSNTTVQKHQFFVAQLSL